MIGASVYFSDLDFKYIETIIDMGIEALFTTVVMPEEKYDVDFYKNIDILKKITKNNDVYVITDISENLYKKLDINSITELKKFGFTGLRLDSGFQDVATIKDLTKDFHVYLNGSHVTEEQLELYRQNNVCMRKLSIMHNFYPKRFSGLEDALFNDINKKCAKYNLNIASFIPGDAKLRGPEYIGLPTIESHRGQAPFVSYLDTVRRGYVDDIFIGDPGVSLFDLKMIISHFKTDVVSIPCDFNGEYGLKDKVIQLRDDYSKELFRVSLKDIRVENCKNNRILNRTKGMVTVDNSFSGRYIGELNICRENLPIDKQVTMIAQIKTEYMNILDYLNRGCKIRFV